MTDLATLGIAVTTNGIDDANAKLDKLVVTTNSAGKAAEDFGTKASTAVKNVGASVTNADRVNSSFASMSTGMTAAKTATDALAASHAGLSTQSMSLFHAIRGSIEQIGMGVPVTQALTAQMNHLTYAASGEGGLAGAFSGVATMAGRLVSSLVNPVTATAALAAGALYLGNSWSESSAQVDRALIGIGARTGATSTDLNNFARANSSATGLTISEARNVAIEFTKTGNIAVQGLKGVGDAIHGYAVLTGQDATAATKTFADALSGDLVKGAEKIDQTYGGLNSGTLEYIRTLELAGDRSGAIQVVLNAMAPANQKAADSVGVLTKAYQGFANVISNVFHGAPNTTSDADKLAQLQAQRAAAAASPSLVGSNAGGYGLLNTGALAGGKSQQLADLDAQIDALQKKMDAFSAKGISGQLNAMSEAGDAVVKSVIPQIDQINSLQKALTALQAAQDTPGVSRSLGQDDNAVTALQNQIAALQDAQEKAANYNQRVKEISTQWGDVGQSVALALEKPTDQSVVARAIQTLEGRG
ncbi:MULTISPECIES: phage tail length tape measure family protein [unclassified Bradyrhizobium]|uniref:phage tail length tape measure family protein n=1 Tax=unclassified Bradyrhizobium TaxID=2631580 RepID=UPI002478EE4F|nr:MULTISPECIES: phage tail length tape measure family protein [unclassified Bradyrhizobium]WGS18943.1 phage tail length tape measure family protein [Bradyrhizobium sp. ISRA463]WGS25776.1 phage tail length tape measure family protein [Bradyrhizobium sp. ISRA464]